MNKGNHLFVAALVFTSACLCAEPLPGYIPKAHSDALTRWLATRPDLRVATDIDCECDEDLSEFRRSESSPDYHPYYTSGDFNRDGRKDFAVILVQDDFRATKWLAIFNGPISARSRPAHLEEDVHGILVFRDGAGTARRLLLGPFFSMALAFEPKGQGYKVTDGEDDGG